MGLLGDFVGAFATNVGNEMYDNERQQQAMALQEALERRRIARAQNIKTKTAVPVPIPFGNPVQRGPGNWEQPTKIERGALLNENTLELDRPASLEDGPYLPATDPNALTPAQAETARQKELDRASRENAARIRGSSRGGGGSTAKPKYELRNIGGEVMRVNVNDPNAKPQSIGPASKSGGSKEESADAIRAKWTSVATAIGSAEGESLRSIAAQYGMDQRGLPTDDESLKSALLAQVDAEFGKRLKGGAKAEQPKQKDADSPPVAGAKKAPDGFWYVQKDGKWFKVN